MIGSIKERVISNKSPPIAPSPGLATGFPRAEHRSKKSAFSQRRQQPPVQKDHENTLLMELPSLSSSRSPGTSLEVSSQEFDTLPEDVSQQNARRVEEMTEEEREEALQEIYSRFGSDIRERLLKTRTTEPPPASTSQETTNEHDSLENTKASVPLLGSLRTSESRPMTPNTQRRLRFAEVKDSDVHVYESQPSSPKRKPLALPPPTPDDFDAKPLPVRGSGNHIRMRQPQAQESYSSNEGEDEEGTPADIRRRFFPDADANDPSLEWITGGAALENEGSQEDTSVIRFDLSGDPIPSELQSTLPTHLGLHHHAGDLAGYTIDDLLLLTRSTVPAQRAAMLEVLSGVLRCLKRRKTSKGALLPDEILEPSRRNEMRAKGLAMGVQALSSKGATLVRAVDVVYEGVVGWDDRPLDLPDFVPFYELESQPSSRPSGEGNSTDSSPPPIKDPLSTLPLPHLLPLISEHFSNPTILPQSSQSSLLQIVHRLASHSSLFAKQVVTTPGLVPSMISCFITKVSAEAFRHSEPFAIEVLKIAASSSRENAETLVKEGIPDTFLRFFTMLPSITASPSTCSELPDPTVLAIIEKSLQLYRLLGSYGLFTSSSSTFSSIFESLTPFILRTISSERGMEQESNVCVEWIGLMEVWMICARDPHLTSPPHGILWSQVTGWGWIDDLLRIREAYIRRLSSDGAWESSATPRRVMTSVWNAIAAFLQGANVNGVRGGENEKNMVKAAMKDSFNSDGKGPEATILHSAVVELGAALQRHPDWNEIELLEISSAALVPQAILHLVGALLPTSSESPSSLDPLLKAADQTSPTISSMDLLSWVPLGDIVALCAKLTAIAPWLNPKAFNSSSDSSRTSPHPFVLARPLTTLLTTCLHLNHRLRSVNVTQWLTSASLTLQVLIPGDEKAAHWIVNEIGRLITEEMVKTSIGWKVPDEVWAKGGINPILPFLLHAIQPTIMGGEVGDFDGDGNAVFDAQRISISSLVTTPQSVSQSTTLSFPSDVTLSNIRTRGGGKSKGGLSFGLPLPSDWVFVPLNDLLRSGSSNAFSNLPEDWSFDELEVVRATLIFSGMFLYNLKQATNTKATTSGLGISHRDVIFAAMKIYMLEHGQKQEDSSEEVFRDTFVCNALLSLLSESRSRQTSTQTETHNAVIGSATQTPLEAASRSFLGDGTPFYQFYTDFVALYDSISFAEPLFASLLLPPLSMSYAPDYRKLLWVDYIHILRTIRTEPDHPVITETKEFMWPLETDGQIVNGYLSALCRTGGLHGLLRYIAIHHLACHIWPDLTKYTLPQNGLEGATWAEKKAQPLLLVLTAQAPHDVIKEVITYNGHYGLVGGVGEELSKEAKLERMEYVAVWGGEPLRGRLFTLLKA